MQRHIIWTVIFLFGGLVIILLSHSFFGNSSIPGLALSLSGMILSGALATVTVRWITRPSYEKELIATINILESIASNDSKSVAFKFVTPSILIKDLNKHDKVSSELREIILLCTSGNQWIEGQLLDQLERIKGLKDGINSAAGMKDRVYK